MKAIGNWKDKLTSHLLNLKIFQHRKKGHWRINLLNLRHNLSMLCSGCLTFLFVSIEFYGTSRQYEDVLTSFLRYNLFFLPHLLCELWVLPSHTGNSVYYFYNNSEDVHFFELTGTIDQSECAHWFGYYIKTNTMPFFPPPFFLPRPVSCPGKTGVDW